jgi:hypothetical protein
MRILLGRMEEERGVLTAPGGNIDLDKNVSLAAEA